MHFLTTEITLAGCFNVNGITDFRETKMHTTRLLVPNLLKFELLFKR